MWLPKELWEREGYVNVKIKISATVPHFLEDKMKTL